MNIYQCGVVCLLVLVAWAAIRRARTRARPLPGQRGSDGGPEPENIPIVYACAEGSERQLNHLAGRRRRRRRRCHYDRFYQDLVRDL